MISLSLFHILAKMLLFLPCYRTNRSVTCGSQSLKLISHDFDNSIAFLTDTTPFPSWDGRMSSWDSSFPLILSVRLPSSVLLHLPKCQALPTCTLWKFLTPSLVHLEEGRWDSVVLNLSLAHVLRRNQLFHLNRETTDRCAVFTSGYWEVHSCVWLPTHSFLHL